MFLCILYVFRIHGHRYSLKAYLQKTVLGNIPRPSSYSAFHILKFYNPYHVDDCPELTCVETYNSKRIEIYIFVASCATEILNTTVAGVKLKE